MTPERLEKLEAEYHALPQKVRDGLRRLAAHILLRVRDTIAEGHLPFYRAYTCHIVEDECCTFFTENEREFPDIRWENVRLHSTIMMQELGKEFCEEYGLEWSTSFIEEQWGKKFRTDAAIEQTRDLRTFWIDYIVRNYL